MNDYELTCTYCGFFWEVRYTSNSDIFCTKCGDRNIIVKNIAKDRIDYYAGAPDFKKDIVDPDWNM